MVSSPRDEHRGNRQSRSANGGSSKDTGPPGVVPSALGSAHHRNGLDGTLDDTSAARFGMGRRRRGVEIVDVVRRSRQPRCETKTRLVNCSDDLRRRWRRRVVRVWGA
jgi:hypothetical protein